MGQLSNINLYHYLDNLVVWRVSHTCKVFSGESAYLIAI
jgi:hypothetical protein